MELLIASSVAFIYKRYLLASIGFMAVGFGGAGVVWNNWSSSSGYTNSFQAFLHPVGLSYGDAFLLVTHAPFALVGIAILVLTSHGSGES